MGSAVGEFTVTVKSKEVVAAALPLQEHWLPLSNLDLLLPPLDVGVFFCYEDNQTRTFSEKARALKEALAEALVSFYALAGEVVRNSGGEPEMICNNRGVDFMVAEADGVELGELRLYEPDCSVEGKLVPVKKNGVLSVQVTELKCGGIVVGCTFDHRIADAYSANMFLVAWAHIATGSTTITPSFRRSLLNPRRPLTYDSSFDHTYVPYSHLSPPPTAITSSTMISRIYHLPADQLSTLQTLATRGAEFKRTTFSTNHKPPSKLQTLSAYLWKLVAQHALELHNDTILGDDTCKMGIVVDGRQRLGPTMDSYFGNVLSIPFARLGVNELANMPLDDVVDEVGRFLASAVTKEHFLGLVDWVEAHRPETAVVRVYTEATGDWTRFCDVVRAEVSSDGGGFRVGRAGFRVVSLPMGRKYGLCDAHA